MKNLLPVAVVALCLIPAARAADDNPVKKVKVNDYAEYKMTTSIMGNSFEGKVKMTVTAKDDKEATIEVVTKLLNNGKEFDLPAQTQKIDLTKPYDPAATAAAAANLPKGTDVKVEKGDGAEKITVGGKQYECTWMKAKATLKFGNMSIESDMKIWTSKDGPLSGMVKMESKSQVANMTMELTGSGSK